MSTARGTSIRFPKVSDGGCLLQALTARDIPFRYLSADKSAPKWRRRPVVEFHVGNVLYYFDGSLRRSDPVASTIPGPLINDLRVARFVKKKDLAKEFLRDHGFSVPKGAAFSRRALSEAETFFAAFAPSLLGGVCVKPSNGACARYVTAGIRDLSSFHAAFETVAKHHERVLVEETVIGKVHRFFCLAGRVIAIHCACIPCVKGNGTHTIADLVNFKNAERRLHPNPSYSRYPLQLTPRHGGLEQSYIPDEGETIFLSNLSDLRFGGEKVDATDVVHHSYINLVERVVGYFPGLTLCGPDVIIMDSSLPATNNNYHVLEINGSGPGFVDHHYPWSGQSRDVTGPLIDHLSTAG